MRSRRPHSRDEGDSKASERRTRDHSGDVELVLLTRKHAEEIDGVSLIGKNVGDRLSVGRRDARLLIAEGWAVPVPAEQRRRAAPDDGWPRSEVDAHR